MDKPTEAEISTRRGLLGAFARTAARHTREAAGVLGPRGLVGLLGLAESSSDAATHAALLGATARPARRPARRPEHAASLDELLALAHAEGLTQRDVELRGLAICSLRMTPVEPAHADAWILTSDDWIAAGDEMLLALINLNATTIGDCALPATGWLALFVKAGDRPVGPEVRHARGVVLGLPATVSDAAEPVALSPELVVPRRWHEAVQALEFNEAEAEAYDRLRTRVQLFQGIESDDDGGPDIAYHRLLGYPNETTGSMPLDCVRALRDWSAADGLGSDVVDPVLPSYECRLLAQVSVGDRRRAYLWIRRTDLDAGDFRKLCAFVR
jgi:hypothetical protein